MSPIIFLMALTPVIKMIKKINCPGFYFNIPIPKSQDLSHYGATIQVLWEEDHSEEPKGWYKSVVLKYNSKGDAELLYPNGTIIPLFLGSESNGTTRIQNLEAVAKGR